MSDFYPQEYDCENGACPNCGDNCLDYAEDQCSETDEAYTHVYRCPGCGHVTTWIETKDDSTWIKLPPYELDPPKNIPSGERP